MAASARPTDNVFVERPTTFLNDLVLLFMNNITVKHESEVRQILPEYNRGSAKVREFQAAGGTVIGDGQPATSAFSSIADFPTCFKVYNDDILWPVCHAGLSRSQATYAYLRTLCTAFMFAGCSEQPVVLKPHGVKSAYLPPEITTVLNEANRETAHLAYLPALRLSTDEGTSMAGFQSVFGHPRVTHIGRFKPDIAHFFDTTSKYYVGGDGFTPGDFAPELIQARKDQRKYFTDLVAGQLVSLLSKPKSDGQPRRLVVVAFADALEAMADFFVKLKDFISLRQITIIFFNAQDEITHGLLDRPLPLPFLSSVDRDMFKNEMILLSWYMKLATMLVPVCKTGVCSMLENQPKTQLNVLSEFVQDDLNRERRGSPSKHVLQTIRRVAETNFVAAMFTYLPRDIPFAGMERRYTMLTALPAISSAAPITGLGGSCRCSRRSRSSYKL